jgi:hypothetical protein
MIVSKQLIVLVFMLFTIANGLNAISFCDIGNTPFLPNCTGLYEHAWIPVIPEASSGVIDVTYQSLYYLPSGTSNDTAYYCKNSQGTIRDDCSSAYIHNDTSWTLNTGDAYYCGNYTCGNVTECTCEETPIQFFTDIVTTGGIFNEIPIFGSLEVGCFLDVNWHGDHPLASRSLLQIIGGETVDYVWTDDPLSVDVRFTRLSPHDLSFQLSKRKDLFFSNHTGDGTASFFTMFPDYWSENSDTVIVKVYSSGVLVSETTHQFTGSKSCELVDCFFCWDSLNNESCLSGTTYAMYIIFRIMSITVMIGIIALVFWMFCGAILSCLWFTITKCFMTSIYFNRTKLFQDIKNTCKKAGGAVGRQFSINDPQPRYVPDNGGQIGVMLPVLLLFIFTPAALGACTTSSVVSSTASACVVDYVSNTRSCNVILTENINMSYQDTMCMSIIDADGIFIEELMLEYDKYVEIVPTTEIYQTYDWEPATCTQLSCEGAAGGLDDSDCNEITANNDPDFSDNSNCANGSVQPGLSMCFFVHPSTTTCPLTNWGDSRLACRGFTQIQTTVAYVREMNAVISNPILNITELYSRTIDSHEVDMATGDYVGSHFEISLNGAYQGLTKGILDDQSVIVFPSEVYLYHASDLNQPTAGMVGDNQSPVSSYTTDVISVDYDIFSITPQPSSCLYSFTTPGLQVMSNDPEAQTFPVHVDGYTWDFDGANVYSEMLPGPTISLTVTFDGNYTYVTEYSNVCPDISGVSVDGQYNLINGAVIYLTIESDCSSGNVIISVDDNDIILSSASLPISHIVNTYEILATFSKGQGEFTMTASFGGLSDSYSSDYDLTEYVPVVTQQNTTQINTEDTDDDDDGWDWPLFSDIDEIFSDVFNGAATAIEWFLFFVIVIFLSVAFLIALFFLLWLLGMILTPIVSCLNLKDRCGKKKSEKVI